MLVVAIFAPLIATHDPTAMSLFDAKQAPSMHHFFGTTDQGTDVFSQVVLGTRNSLFLGAAAAGLATILAAKPRHPRAPTAAAGSTTSSTSRPTSSS